ncbi:MAG TPA: flagellar biosynthesis anti-sigma factor FlgM [Chthonomonadales bacterium]|nr:flagellar biosynthesis anti-sigma factor FlgM [Chthonomonadales bacterium]
MKISTQELDRVLQSRAGIAITSSPSSGIRPTEAPRSQGQAASVEISAEAQEVRRVKDMVDQVPDVRENLVESLRAKMQKGDYQVGSADIADLMVRRLLADSMQ